MKRRVFLSFGGLFFMTATFFLCLVLAGGCSDDEGSSSHKRHASKRSAPPAPVISLEHYEGGFFTIDKPRGWEIIPAGQCSSFAFLIRDPQEHRRQIFHFGEVGPVYMDHRQKQIDMQYMQMGGYPIQWIEMPVVNPLTPANFLAQFHLIARTRIAQSFMPQCPRLEGFSVISTTPQQCPINGGRSELVRALFTQNGKVAEGLFTATVAPVMPMTGSPGGGTAYGVLVSGITAPRGEFPHLQEALTRSIGSYSISQDYANRCLQQQAATYAGIMRAGQTLRETSDIITRGWENRNKTHDILAERRSDTILGKERLYDADTGEVYEFENGFYDRYDLNRQQYEMNNLQQLPNDNHNLWMQAPLDGARNLR